MPATIEQIQFGSEAQFSYVVKNDPVDQVNANRPFLKWLIANKQPTTFMNGIVNEKIYDTNGDNAQRFTGNDQLTYEHEKPTALAPFKHYELFKGFTLNRTELGDNGIVVTDGPNAKMTDAEKLQIINLVNNGYRKQKNAMQSTLDGDLHMDGSLSSLQCPGLDLLVATDPTTGVVGNIDAATNLYWRNLASLNISTADPDTFLGTLKSIWRQCSIYGGIVPDAIFGGEAFCDAYETALRKTNQGRFDVSGKGGAKIDGGIAEAYFNGVTVQHDPTFEALDALYAPATPWTKRCYFLSSQSLHLRPNTGKWMIRHRPQQLPDRFVLYYGHSTDYGLTVSQRNNMAVVSIA